MKDLAVFGIPTELPRKIAQKIFRKSGFQMKAYPQTADTPYGGFTLFYPKNDNSPDIIGALSESGAGSAAEYFDRLNRAKTQKRERLKDKRSEPDFAFQLKDYKETLKLKRTSLNGFFEEYYDLKADGLRRITAMKAAGKPLEEMRAFAGEQDKRLEEALGAVLKNPAYIKYKRDFEVWIEENRIFEDAELYPLEEDYGGFGSYEEQYFMETAAEILQMLRSLTAESGTVLLFLVNSPERLDGLADCALREIAAKDVTTDTLAFLEAGKPFAVTGTRPA
jgi:hypothetical protein